MLGVGIIGCGALGSILAKEIDIGEAGEVRLVGVLDKKMEAAEKLSKTLRKKPKIFKTIEEMLADKEIDIVVETASQEAVRQYSEKILKAGKDLVILSVGALADKKLLSSLIKIAKKTGKKIYVPSGAILGVDGIKAISMREVDEVLIITRKPPRALSYSEYVKRKRIDLKKMRHPKVIFEGPAKEAVKFFPASVNVAATVSLAGVGFDKTKVKIIVDPTLKRNIHEIHIRGVAGEYSIIAKNLPTAESAKTSMLAALSTVRLLKSLQEPLKIGE
ncbi:MAG: aspartate dehydrogenase [Candidatus Hadarchaeales archaeon]